MQTIATGYESTCRIDKLVDIGLTFEHQIESITRVGNMMRPL